MASQVLQQTERNELQEDSNPGVEAYLNRQYLQRE